MKNKNNETIICPLAIRILMIKNKEERVRQWKALQNEI